MDVYTFSICFLGFLGLGNQTGSLLQELSEDDDLRLDFTPNDEPFFMHGVAFV